MVATLRYSLARVTAPATGAVTLAQARSHLRVSSTADNTDIKRLVKLAVDRVERDSRRALFSQTWDLKLPDFPSSVDWVELPIAPLNTVNISTGIQYVDTDGVTQNYASTQSGAGWELDLNREPGLLRLKYNQSWPAVRCQEDAVTIRFVVGSTSVAKLEATPYGETARHAALLLVDDWYNHRGSQIVGTSASEMPYAYKQLIAALRWGDYH